MVNAWQEVHSSVTVPQQWRVIHFDFDAPLDIFVVLDFFGPSPGRSFSRAVILVPPASTWSRARHFAPIKCPLRTRAHPLVLPNLATSAQSKVHDANLAVEVSTWFAAEALQCEASSVTAVLLFPEDLGGHSVSGPTSPWTLKEWRDLEGLGEARRGSVFWCRFAGADQQRPIGMLTNLQLIHAETFPGWPAHFFVSARASVRRSTSSVMRLSPTSICSTRQPCSVSRTASGCACGVRFCAPIPLRASGMGHLLGLPGLRLLVPLCRRAQALFPGCTRRGAVGRSRERIFVTWALPATSRSTSPASPTSSPFPRTARPSTRGVLLFCWVVCLLSRSRFLRLCVVAPRVLRACCRRCSSCSRGCFKPSFRTLFLPSLPRSVFLVLPATFLVALKLRSQRASRAREARSFCLELTSSSQGPMTGCT